MKPNNQPHQRNLRKGRFLEPGRAYALTKCTLPGLSLTEDSRVATCLIETFLWMDKHQRFTLGAFVVMPDHYHLVIALHENTSLVQVMRSVGAYSAREMNRILKWGGQLWQRGYYDRAIRKTEDMTTIFDYIHGNPVRRGLVERPEEWPYSSFAPSYRERTRWDVFA